MQPLELWGGHECSVNRVGDRYMDQTRLSGHQQRPDDIDRFTGLGVRALRYPVLWERIAPESPSGCDWRWTDERLARIRDQGVKPIAGLVHHGSGPRYTNLLDSGFAPGLAQFAAYAAARYPWIDDWTPVNEPLTTARFSTLYGHWYPHRHDEVSFWNALLNQIDATRLAMTAIRQINPAARLIQTEDLGRTYSTRAMAHQASHDNARRWMTWDLLCGAVRPGHELFERVSRFGLGDRLRAIADDPSPPDVIGVNHYLTSDRFLDHRCERYPADRRGANEFMQFADVEAVRVLLPAPGGLEERLLEAWKRYGRPLAVTEAHNGCTREEQLRWAADVWEAAMRARQAGAQVEAVTAWALLGSYDWNSLLTRSAGHYEVGAFDVSGGEPRPTALAHTLKALAAGTDLSPAATGDGWWRRDVRIEFQPHFRTVETPEARPTWQARSSSHRPLLITGATGTLGKALARACEWRGLAYVLTDRAQLDIGAPQAIEAALADHDPWAVINAAGWVRVDDAESNEAACRLANVEGAVQLARACAARGIGFAGFSSDLVFDGAKRAAYVESDIPAPLGAYGRSKAHAEAGVLAAGGLMIRTAAFFSPYDPHNFAAHVLRSLSGGKRMAAAADLFISPTYVPDLVDATLDLVIDGEAGLWHLANQGAVSWYGFAHMLARTLGLDGDLIIAASAASMNMPAARPRNAALATSRSRLMPGLENAVERYAAKIRAAQFAGDFEALIDREIVV